jgi:fatty-acyl-CoA synthase
MILRSDKGPKLQVPVVDFVKTARRYTGEKLLTERKFRPNDIAAYFPAGRSKGIPKLVPLTHFNQVFAAWAAAEMLPISAKHKVFCGHPLHQAGTVMESSLIPWMKGATVMLGSPSGFRSASVVENFWRIVEFFDINFFSGYAEDFSALLTVPFEETDISSLNLALSSNRPPPAKIIQQFEAATKVRLLGGYGLTEGAGFSALNPFAGKSQAGSIGLRLPYQEMAVVQLDKDGNFMRLCAVQESGSIILRGPTIFAGYKDDSHNQSIWVNTRDGQGLWLNSGDFGRTDEQGYFWLSDQE